MNCTQNDGYLELHRRGYRVNFVPFCDRMCPFLQTDKNLWDTIKTNTTFTVGNSTNIDYS